MLLPTLVLAHWLAWAVPAPARAPTPAQAATPTDAARTARTRVEITWAAENISVAQTRALRRELESLLARQGTDAAISDSHPVHEFASDEILAPFPATVPALLRIWLQFLPRGLVRLGASIRGGERFFFRDISLASGLDGVGRETVAQVVASSVAALIADPTQGIDRAAAERHIAGPAAPPPARAETTPSDAPPPSPIFQSPSRCWWPLCHNILLRSLSLTPWPETVAPDITIRVRNVGVGRLTGANASDVEEASHFAVEIEIENRTTAPARVWIDDTRLVLDNDGAGPPRAFASIASGAGPLPIAIDDRGRADFLWFPPGERRPAWVDFSGFARNSVFRPRVTLSVPIEIAGQKIWRAVVVSQPGQAIPYWQTDLVPTFSMNLAVDWWVLPRGLDAAGARYGFGATSGNWFWGFSTAVSILTNPYADGRNDAGFGLGAQFGRSYSAALGGGRWASIAPTLGVQGAFFRHDVQYAGTNAHPVTHTILAGAVAGVSLFLDRDRPSQGPFPLPGPRPRHGSILGLQLLFVHWFGVLKDESVRGPGFLGSISFGLNIP